MSTPFPAPRYALDEQVRYRPLQPQPDWPTAWHPEPWRIVGRLYTEMLQATPALRYVIQPAMLSGHWRGHDQPLVVGEDQLTAWDPAQWCSARTARAVATVMSHGAVAGVRGWDSPSPVSVPGPPPLVSSSAPWPQKKHALSRCTYMLLEYPWQATHQ